MIKVNVITNKDQIENIERSMTKSKPRTVYSKNTDANEIEIVSIEKLINKFNMFRKMYLNITIDNLSGQSKNINIYTMLYDYNKTDLLKIVQYRDSAKHDIIKINAGCKTCSFKGKEIDLSDPQNLIDVLNGNFSKATNTKIIDKINESYSEFIEKDEINEMDIRHLIFRLNYLILTNDLFMILYFYLVNIKIDDESDFYDRNGISFEQISEDEIEADEVVAIQMPHDAYTHRRYVSVSDPEFKNLGKEKIYRVSFR